jgi:hypothetical protein
LDTLYRRWSGDPPGGGEAFSREVMLQNIQIAGVLIVLFLLAAVFGVTK